MSFLKNDTICAIATASGTAAVSMIRMSGKDSHKIAISRFIRKKELKINDIVANRMYYGEIADLDGKIIDDVMLTFFKAPHSYTGEDSAEIVCHGSPFIQNKILEILIQSGARLAEAGEYTMRAFVNNKMDLTQAEAVAEKEPSYKIAFVLIDTLTSQYQKCRDLEEEFNQKRANAESTITAKGKSFQTQMQEFNRKYQSNQFTQQQFEAEQARLAKLQQDLEELQIRLSNSLQEEYQKEFQELTDTIQSFTKSYAKAKGYDFILCKSSGIDNVLYANEAYDITDEVVKGLNKRYELASAKKEEEK